MSALQTSDRFDPDAVQASLNRLHLLYRFDLRQRTWVLQALETRNDFNSAFPAGVAALASAISGNFSTRPNVSGGRAGRLKSAARQ